MKQTEFIPTREAGLKRLDDFAASMGAKYAADRNAELGQEDRSNVSCLSPWLRHRSLTEKEVVETALSRFKYSTAEKFIQEVCWRTYFKGWLEHRPTVWTEHCKARDRWMGELSSDSGLSQRYGAAISGKIGIDGFDHWATELIETGYLHNHARMWFASIWMFTLKLPWELGADFFLQHLIDGDPASNTSPGAGSAGCIQRARPISPENPTSKNTQAAAFHLTVLRWMRLPSTVLRTRLSSRSSREISGQKARSACF